LENATCDFPVSQQYTLIGPEQLIDKNFLDWVHSNQGPLTKTWDWPIQFA